MEMALSMLTGFLDYEIGGDDGCFLGAICNITAIVCKK